MPGPWKPWKTKRRFSTVPTAPWKSHTPRFPHSHSADDESVSSEPKTKTQRAVEKWKSQTAGFPLSHRPEAAPAILTRTPIMVRSPLPELGDTHPAKRKEQHSQPGWATCCGHTFRLIPHWNPRRVSGSSRVGIKSRVQAHFWIGKCFQRLTRCGGEVGISPIRQRSAPRGCPENR
jgi:hypothetical protein